MDRWKHVDLGGQYGMGQIGDKARERWGGGGVSLPFEAVPEKKGLFLTGGRETRGSRKEFQNREKWGEGIQIAMIRVLAVHLSVERIGALRPHVIIIIIIHNIY